MMLGATPAEYLGETDHILKSAAKKLKLVWKKTKNYKLFILFYFLTGHQFYSIVIL